MTSRPLLIYRTAGEVVEMSLHEAQEDARPECHHCGDFRAELADVSYGGVACMDWTITVLRSARGEALFDDMVNGTTPSGSSPWACPERLRC